jgi:hypothetical protein
MNSLSWHSGGGVVFIEFEEAEPVEAAPRLDIPSYGQFKLRWPYLLVDSRQQRTVFIRELGDRRVTVIAPIPVSVESSEGQATACCYDLEQFGVGDDEFSALDDLRATVVELYFALKDEPRLGPLPQRQLDYLKKVIREI